MPLAKPSTPVWQPGRAPAGCQLYLPIAEGAGTRVRDLCNATHGTFVGAPAWGRGAYGPQVTGFTAADYFTIPDVPGLKMASSFWVAVMLEVPAASPATYATALMKTTTGSWNDGYGIYWYNTNPVFFAGHYSLDFNAATAPVSFGATTVVMGTFSDLTVKLYVNGILGGSKTLAGPPPDTAAEMRVGHSMGGEPYPGSLLALAYGRLAIPDPLKMANDWLSGRFAAVRTPVMTTTLAAGLDAGGGGATLFRRTRGLRTGSRGAA